MEQAPANDKPIVLVVDDQKTMRMLVGESLTSAGFACIEANGGEAALSALESNIPDLIVLDVLMPGMDGYQVCRTIRLNPSHRHLPILVMTGLEDEASINQAFESGATDFIGKPFKPVVLVNRVKFLMRACHTEQRIQKLAYFDPLTELWNRESLRVRLSQAVALAGRQRRQVGLLFLDLDDFKRVNDTLGHSVGDRLLKMVAGRLKKCVRQSDSVGCPTRGLGGNMVARLGGDEFIVLLHEIDCAEDAARVARRILHALSSPFDLENQEVYITPSIGISVYPQDAADGESLQRCADTAMYHAKRKGKNLYQYFDESMNVAAKRRMVLDSQLRRALEKEEFTLHYQPQVDVDGDLRGVESLLRWRNESLGEISPAEFVPLAEENGMIVKIGDWVIRQSCAQVRRWLDGGLDPGRIAVNISAIQFGHPEFVPRVSEILGEFELDPGRLEMEITESLLMKNAELSLDTLAALKLLGVSLAIDDFGTGYSSLNYLKQFPVDRLKIDRSFVREIITDPDDAAIATAVAAMAASMNLGVIAEGVENQAQMAFLAQRGCHEFQGFYFSTPLSCEELTRRLQSRSRWIPEPVVRSRCVVYLGEDEHLARDLRCSVEPHGLKMFAASRVRDALDLMSNRQVMSVVVDGRLHGPRSLRHVERIDPCVPRIFLSGPDVEPLTGPGFRAIRVLPRETAAWVLDETLTASGRRSSPIRLQAADAGMPMSPDVRVYDRPRQDHVEPRSSH